MHSWRTANSFQHFRSVVSRRLYLRNGANTVLRNTRLRTGFGNSHHLQRSDSSNHSIRGPERTSAAFSGSPALGAIKSGRTMNHSIIAVGKGGSFRTDCGMYLRCGNYILVLTQSLRTSYCSSPFSAPSTSSLRQLLSRKQHHGVSS